MTLRLFTFSEPCPYLAGKTSRGDLIAESEPFVRYEALIPLGWRRSGAYLYRYRCPGCSLCIPIRLSAGKLYRGERFARLMKRNSDLSMKLCPGLFRDEHFALYEKYLADRHGGEGPAEEGYRAMIGAPMTAISEYRDRGGKLCALGILDILPSGFSSVYFAFDSSESRRSLGSYSVYAESDFSAALGKEYYYLGFWVPGARKMDYKADFRPFELALPKEDEGSETESGRRIPLWTEFEDKEEALRRLSATRCR